MKPGCEHSEALRPLQGKWKGEIVYCLKDGPVRLGDIERRLPDAIPRVLKRQLRELENDGIVRRKTISEIPPKVEYSLTVQGQWLYSLVCTINEAAEEYIRKSKALKK